MTPDDLRPLLDRLQKTGGELAVGLINAASDHSLVRLRIEMPPGELPKPVLPPRPVEPQPPEKTGNPLTDAVNHGKWQDAHEQWDADLQRWQTEVDAINASWQSEVDTRLGAWQQQSNAAVANFMNEVLPLLAEQPGGWTDIEGGLKRCDLFGSEPHPEWPTTRPITAAITDGLDTLGGQPIVLSSNPTILIVNATAVSGILEGYQPQRFESISAAFNFIIQQ